MSALPLVLASAFTHALWNARLKRAADREAAAALLVGGAAVLSGLLALILGYVFRHRIWGKHLFAIGGNEAAARMTGVDVDRIKFQAYVFSAFTASVASLLILGYSGSAINAKTVAASAWMSRDADRMRSSAEVTGRA